LPARAKRYETGLSVRCSDIELRFHVVLAGPERLGCGAGGSCVTEVRFLMLAALAASIKLTGNTLPVMLPLLMVHFAPARRPSGKA